MVAFPTADDHVGLRSLFDVLVCEYICGELKDESISGGGEESRVSRPLRCGRLGLGRRYGRGDGGDRGALAVWVGERATFGFSDFGESRNI